MRAFRREPLWTVEIGDPMDPRELFSGWRIHRPFTEIPDQTLVLHAIKGNGNDGGYIALAIRDGVTVDHLPGLQSNPRRQPDHGYGSVEGD